jgi:CubicO group peptidase (beta-lactamase class C family)
MRNLPALASLFALAAPVLAGGLPKASPEDLGMSEPVLRSGVALFEEAVKQDDLRGAVLLVARKGRIVLHEAVGWRDIERKLPMERDTLFRMASNTKPVTATSILLLQQEEKLSVDDNVRKHIPSWDNYRAGSIKIRHLLSHTSGLRIPVIFFQPPADPPSLRAEVDRFGEVGADEQPGTTYSYNNPGFNTLGAIIEAVSGLSLRDFYRQRIYEPLGMAESFNHEPEAPQERMAVVYRRAAGQAWKAAWRPGDPPDYPFVRASGGLISSAEDYVRFCQMFLSYGTLEGRRLLTRQSVEAATRKAPGSGHGPEGSAGYGYGWSIDADGSYSHGGSDGTFAWVDPKREVIGLVLTQSPGGEIRRDQFRRVVEASIYSD